MEYNLIKYMRAFGLFHFVEEKTNPKQNVDGSCNARKKGVCQCMQLIGLIITW